MIMLITSPKGSSLQNEIDELIKKIQQGYNSLARPWLAQ
jgi:hypothetical protein